MTNECCVERKALEEIRFHVKADPQMERTYYSVNRTGAAEIARLADAALAAPSECAQLREKLAVAEAKIEALIAVVKDLHAGGDHLCEQLAAVERLEAERQTLEEIKAKAYHEIPCGTHPEVRFVAGSPGACGQMIEESLSRLHNATQVELVRIEADRAFWERKYRALEDYCFRKLIPQYIQAFARIAGSELCLHEDIEVSLKDERGYNANGYWAKCARCSFIITDSNAYPPGHVILEEIDKLMRIAAHHAGGKTEEQPK